MAAKTSEDLQMLSTFSIPEISVGNFTLIPFVSESFRLVEGNCLSILILTEISEFLDEW